VFRSGGDGALPLVAAVAELVHVEWIVTGRAGLIDATYVVHAEAREEAIPKATKGESCRPPAARTILRVREGVRSFAPDLYFFQKHA
jgi:hypothetical protein